MYVYIHMYSLHLQVNTMTITSEIKLSPILSENHIHMISILYIIYSD